MASNNKGLVRLGDLLGDLDPGLAKALDGLGKGVLGNAEGQSKPTEPDQSAEAHRNPSASPAEALAKHGANREVAKSREGRAPASVALIRSRADAGSTPTLPYLQ